MAIEKEFDYAINYFFMGMGKTTYDLEIVRRGRVNDVYAAIPGSRQGGTNYAADETLPPG